MGIVRQKAGENMLNEQLIEWEFDISACEGVTPEILL